MPSQGRRPKLSGAPIPPYHLPAPLRLADGSEVSDTGLWLNRRRRELLALFSSEVYGKWPHREGLELTTTREAVDHHAIGGKAIRVEMRVEVRGATEGLSATVLVFIPKRAVKPVPAFLGLNFEGNHTVLADSGISLSQAWVYDTAAGAKANRATDYSRGTDASKWQIEAVIDRGFATATVYAGDFSPDHSGGLEQGFSKWLGSGGVEGRGADAPGAIGFWAWGLSRSLDVLGGIPEIDAAKVIVHGHSRLGKAALWAAANDLRFAAVISNESGCGGAALSKRLHGESVAAINRQFPHWFAKNFRRYAGNEDALPVDQHELIALAAPRPAYVASAEEDDWADPESEFLALKNAQPVFSLFGIQGPPSEALPNLNEPAGDLLRYHIRAGAHDMTRFDWDCYLDFAERVFGMG